MDAVLSKAEGSSGDRRKKILEKLGHDPAMLDSDPDYAAMLIMSFEEEEEKRLEEEKKVQAALEAEKKRKKEEEAKLKAARELQKLKDEGLVGEKVEYQYLGVLSGIGSIKENDGCYKALFTYLKGRLVQPDSEDGEFTERL